MTASQVISVDLCVIGAGAAGLAVVSAAAAFGVPAALVEKGAMGGSRLGGDGAASVALAAAARRASDVRRVAGFGLDASLGDIDLARVMARARQIALDAAPNDSQARFEAIGVRVIRAAARFVDSRTVTAGDMTIRARRFVIATGSTPAIPDIPGLKEASFLTSRTIFDLAEPPRHLIVIGGGATGVEFSQAFARLGSRVTLLDAGAILADEDPEMARIALAQLARDGVALRERVAIERVEDRAGSVSLALSGGEICEGTHLLIAAGRSPEIDGLDLDKAGVAFGPQGIAVDHGLRASNRRIYAIGGCAAGQPSDIHVAGHQASLVIKSALFRMRGSFDAAATPRVVFTDPEIASCGLLEPEARAQRSDVVTLRWPFAENDRACAERAIDGHVKLMIARKGRILGVAIVGRGASEQIGLWSLALAKNMQVRDIAELILPYPTMADASKRAALAALTPWTQQTRTRRLIAFLRKFG